MSFLISISESPDDMWMVRNSISRWFVNLFCERYASEPLLVEEIEAALRVQGLGLHTLYSEQPEVALKFRDSIHQLANEIAGGHHIVCDDDEPTADQDRSAAHFAELATLLDRFPH
jgi:hypothetical protein